MVLIVKVITCLWKMTTMTKILTLRRRNITFKLDTDSRCFITSTQIYNFVKVFGIVFLSKSEFNFDLLFRCIQFAKF